MANQTALAGYRIVAALAIVFLLPGCASVRNADIQADDPEARASIERRLHELFAAAQSKDFDRLESTDVCQDDGNRSLRLAGGHS
jgi:hypothetical protein